MAVNLNGVEAVKICGQIQCGNAASDFALLAHADPGSNLGDHAAAVALDCVALACERDATNHVAPNSSTHPSCD